MAQINAIKIDLIGDHAVECGTDYERVVKVCGQPDLTTFQGYCEVKKGNTKAFDAVISILSVDSFKIIIPWTLTDSDEFRTLVSTPGDFVYDVLFAKSDNRFYSVRGKIAFILSITRIPAII